LVLHVDKTKLNYRLFASTCTLLFETTAFRKTALYDKWSRSNPGSVAPISKPHASKIIISCTPTRTVKN